MKFPNFTGSAFLRHDKDEPVSKAHPTAGGEGEGGGGVSRKGERERDVGEDRQPGSMGSTLPRAATDLSSCDLTPSKYPLDSPKTPKWNILHPRALRHSRICWLLIPVTIAVLVVVLTTVLVLTNRAGASINVTVDLGYSKYQGISATDHAIVEWLGIRYAAPPLGDLRFRAPQPPLMNATLQRANAYGATCLPTPSTGLMAGFSEDCLFLNVYGPARSAAAHPVFVFIQGGGFNGNAPQDMDSPSLIKAGDYDMIVVTFNYRVGPWGFLASQEVQSDGDLNVGLLDQRFVLQWVQTYIHLFGGDPDRVTIGGSSAGAASVDLHLSAYGGRDDKLFIAAAAESQSFGAQLTIEESQYQYDGLVNRTGCSKSQDTLQCLRALDVAILAKYNSVLPTPGGAGGRPVFMYSNVIDGNFTQDYTYNMYAQGKFVKVPTIFGSTTNEGTVFTPRSLNNYSDVNNFLRNNFVKLNASHLAEIDSLYPKAEQYPRSGAFWLTGANAYGEMRYNCPGIFISSMFDKYGTPGWNYHWDVLSSANAASGLGVTHSAEVNSVFGMSGPPDNGLIPTIQGYWASFIRAQDPNMFKLSSAPEWTNFTEQAMQRVHFVNNPSQVAMENVPIDQKTRCAYLSSIGAAIAQ